jgi:hypothetical protein
MSADSPASSGDADQPTNSQPDRSPEPDHQPERTPQPEQPAAPADTGQPASNRSRAEYATTLRSAGWDSQPSSPPASADQTPPTPTADHDQQAPAADEVASPRDSEPARNEETGQPDAGPAALASETSRTVEPGPVTAYDTEPATASQSDDHTRVQDQPLNQPGSDTPGTARPDTSPAAEANDNSQPADTAAAAQPADQINRTDYTTSLRTQDPWQATADQAPDSVRQAVSDNQPTEDIPSAGQEVVPSAQDRPSDAGQAADPIDPISSDTTSRAAEDVGPSLVGQPVPDAAAASRSADRPSAADDASSAEINLVADHQATSQSGHDQRTTGSDQQRGTNQGTGTSDYQGTETAESSAANALSADRANSGEDGGPRTQCRLLRRGRQVSPDEFVIVVVPLVFHGE